MKANMATMISTLLCLSLPFAGVSCATSYMWSHTDPYVTISQADITENELQAKHLKYYRWDEYKVFCVQKEGIEKYKDYAIRLFATPITVTIDVATPILVVGGVLLLCHAENTGHGSINLPATTTKPTENNLYK